MQQSNQIVLAVVQIHRPSVPQASKRLQILHVVQFEATVRGFHEEANKMPSIRKFKWQKPMTIRTRLPCMYSKTQTDGILL